jgi:hypothetical protein
MLATKWKEVTDGKMYTIRRCCAVCHAPLVTPPFSQCPSVLTAFGSSHPATARRTTNVTHQHMTHLDHGVAELRWSAIIMVVIATVTATVMDICTVPIAIAHITAMDTTVLDTPIVRLRPMDITIMDVNADMTTDTNTLTTMTEVSPLTWTAH